MRIAATDAGERVWNLAVEDDETYIASGVIVHNCRSQLIEVFFDQTGLAVPTPVPTVTAAPGFGFNPGQVYADALSV
jgi:hypothetical protein